MAEQLAVGTRRKEISGVPRLLSAPVIPYGAQPMGEALRRVLIVEDNDSDVIAATRILRGYNVAISILKDGFQAMEYLLNLSGGEAFPDLILLDLSLPGNHGLDVLRKLKAQEKTKALRIVILTGNHEEKMAMQCYKLNCEGVLMKPLTLLMSRLISS